MRKTSRPKAGMGRCCTSETQQGTVARAPVPPQYAGPAGGRGGAGTVQMIGAGGGKAHLHYLWVFGRSEHQYLYPVWQRYRWPSCSSSGLVHVAFFFNFWLLCYSAFKWTSPNLMWFVWSEGDWFLSEAKCMIGPPSIFCTSTCVLTWVSACFCVIISPQCVPVNVELCVTNTVPPSSWDILLLALWSSLLAAQTHGVPLAGHSHHPGRELRHTASGRGAQLACLGSRWAQESCREGARWPSVWLTFWFSASHFGFDFYWLCGGKLENKTYFNLFFFHNGIHDAVLFLVS